MGSVSFPFCFSKAAPSQVLQQQVKRSIAVGYAVWVAKSKTSQWGNLWYISCRVGYAKMALLNKCGYSRT